MEWWGMIQHTRQNESRPVFSLVALQQARSRKLDASELQRLRWCSNLQWIQWVWHAHGVTVSPIDEFFSTKSHSIFTICSHNQEGVTTYLQFISHKKIVRYFPVPNQNKFEVRRNKQICLEIMTSHRHLHSNWPSEREYLWGMLFIWPIRWVHRWSGICGNLLMHLFPQQSSKNWHARKCGIQHDQAQL